MKTAVTANDESEILEQQQVARENAAAKYVAEILEQKHAATTITLEQRALERRAVLAGDIGEQATSRKSSDTALYEARTLLGAGAGSSRTRLPSWPQFWTGSAAHCHWRRSSEQNRERRQHKRSMSRFSSAADQDGKSSSGVGPYECPGIITATRKDWMALLKGALEPAAASSPLRALPNRTKRHCDGRNIGGFERQHVMRFQISGELEYAAQDTGPDEAGKSPLLGLSGPDSQLNVHWSPAEVSAVVTWHRAATTLKTAKKQLEVPTGWGTPQDNSESCSSNHHDACESRLAPQGQRGRGAKSKDG